MRRHVPRGRTALLASLAALTAGATLVSGCSGGSGGPPDRSGAPGAKNRGVSSAQAPTPPKEGWAKARTSGAERPRSVAAVGDSISRGFDACSPISDCPRVSWATGTDTRVGSLASRLRPGTSWNLARTGASMADLPAQMTRAAARKPDLITVLMGANDACTRDAETMTPVADFRADFERALRTVHRELPDTLVLVGSVPDLEHLWRVGRRKEEARQVWQFGICPSMLARPGSQAAPDQERRASVGERVARYNEVLDASCTRYDWCRSDGGAVHRYAFTSRDLSPWDWFHPGVRGQAALARLLYEAAFGEDG